MMIRARTVATITGGVWALGCRTPSSIGTPEPVGGDGASMSWPAPSPGKTFTLMPTPKTVAIGWYDAAGEPVLHVGSGDDGPIAGLQKLFANALAANGGSTLEGWRAVCIALVTAPEFSLY